MKINELQVQDYGVFSGWGLSFDEHPFHVIYGPNEAGKSTLLELLREMLFGFNRKSAYHDIREAPAAASMACVLADGTSVDFAREKRKSSSAKELTGTLTGGDALDKERLAVLLGNADRALFETVFAFSLKELALGREALKQANVAERIFSIGAGGLSRFTQHPRRTSQDSRHAAEAARPQPDTETSLGAVSTPPRRRFERARSFPASWANVKRNSKRPRSRTPRPRRHSKGQPPNTRGWTGSARPTNTGGTSKSRRPNWPSFPSRTASRFPRRTFSRRPPNRSPKPRHAAATRKKNLPASAANWPKRTTASTPSCSPRRAVSPGSSRNSRECATSARAFRVSRRRPRPRPAPSPPKSANCTTPGPSTISNRCCDSTRPFISSSAGGATNSTKATPTCPTPKMHWPSAKRN